MQLIITGRTKRFSLERLKCLLQGALLVSPTSGYKWCKICAATADHSPAPSPTPASVPAPDVPATDVPSPLNLSPVSYCCRELWLSQGQSQLQKARWKKLASSTVSISESGRIWWWLHPTPRRPGTPPLKVPCQPPVPAGQLESTASLAGCLNSLCCSLRGQGHLLFLESAPQG